LYILHKQEQNAILKDRSREIFYAFVKCNGQSLTRKSRDTAPFSGTPFNPFIFIKNKRRAISSEGFSALEKNAVVRFQRAVLPIQSDITARCRLKWLFGALFLKCELVVSGVGARTSLSWLFGALQIKKKSAPKGHYFQQRAATPDQIAQ
jgi:hypothetical protein